MLILLRLLSILLIICGIVVNKWTVESIVVPDGELESSFAIGLVLFGQFVCLASGCGLFRLSKNLESAGGHLIALLIGSCFALVFGEICARAYMSWLAPEDMQRIYSLYENVENEDFVFIPHHYLSYSLNPSYARGERSHNLSGFRGREIRDKREGDFRIVCIGGSTTYTAYVEKDEDSYPSKLQDFLRERFDGEHIEVLNAGVGGYSSWESLINVLFRVLELNPDLVVIYHGVNDVASRLVETSYYKADNSGRRKYWASPKIPLYARSVLVRILLRAVGFFPPATVDDFTSSKYFRGQDWNSEEAQKANLLLLKENPPIFYRQNLENIIAILKNRSIKVMLASFAYTTKHQDALSKEYMKQGISENNDVMKRVALEMGVIFYDFEKDMPDDKQFWFDGMHVNELGSARKAELFGEFIAEQRELVELLER